MAGRDCGAPGVDGHWTARNRIHDEDAGFVNPRVPEGRAEELTGPPYERTAEADLLLSWRLADQNKRRRCVASAPDGGTNPAIGAGITVLDRSGWVNGCCGFHHV